ncbi:FAD dependent oxidoreductase, partial [mine drainage metagenome]
MSALGRDRYSVAIVGAGIVGLFTAYRLARAGAGPVLVVDRGFLSGGASGRNGGGVRQQWETRATVRLARESVADYRAFGREFGYNIWFRQGGYLFLAESEAELAKLRGVTEVVRAEGLPARLLDAVGVDTLVEGIARGAAVGGAYLASDGTLYPFPAVW